MPNALPDTDGLVDDLNSLRKRGVILTNQFRIASLQKKINAIKLSNSAAGNCYQASLWCLTGDSESLVAAVNSIHSESDLYVENALNYVVSLAASGLFLRARELFDGLGDEYLSDDIAFIAKGISCIAFGRVSSLINSAWPDEVERFMNISIAHDIMEQSGVSENDVAKMLDIAGVVLSKHDLLHSGAPRIIPFKSHGTVNISLPVMVTAEEVADLEWEFCERLFTEFPEAPVHVAHVGFCTGE